MSRNRVEKEVREFIKELPKFFKVAFKIGLGIETNVKLWGKAVMSLVASLITLGAIALVVNKTIVWTGYLYFLLSMCCHIAVAFVNSGGSWFNPLTGALYDASLSIKEELIKTDGFAKFLNSLADAGGFFSKALQIALLLLCVVFFSILLMVTFKCVTTLVVSTIQLIQENREDPPKSPPRSRSNKRRSPKIEYINL